MTDELLTSESEAVQEEWVSEIRNLLMTVEPSVWVRETSSQNFADGGQSWEINVQISDSASMVGTEYGPLFHHRYEVDFFEKNSLRGRISITYSLLYDDSDSALNELYYDVGNGYSQFDRTPLFDRTWPMFVSFVEREVIAFGWDRLDLSKAKPAEQIPIASAYFHDLPY